MKISYHPWSCNLGPTVALITVEKMWRNEVEERDNKDPKGNKCHSWNLRRAFSSCLMYPPFWFSILASKKLCSYYWKENIQRSLL